MSSNFRPGELVVLLKSDRLFLGSTGIQSKVLSEDEILLITKCSYASVSDSQFQGIDMVDFVFLSSDGTMLYKYYYLFELKFSIRKIDDREV